MTMMIGSVGFCQQGTVVVLVNDVLAEWAGTLRIGLFEEEHFPKEGKGIMVVEEPVRGLKAEVVFENVPIGTYAIAVYQDIDNNGKLNRDLYGRPEEPHAFSMNRFGRRGPPQFMNVSFSVNEGETTGLEINLQQ